LQNPEWSTLSYGGDGRSIKQLENGNFLLFSTQVSPYTTGDVYLGHCFNRVLDTSGQVLSEITIGTDSMNAHYGYIDPVASLGSDQFAAIVTHYAGTKNWHELARINDSGEIDTAYFLFYNSIADSLNLVFRCLSEDNGSGYIAAGFAQPSGESANVYLLRIGQFGDTLWSRRYEQGAQAFAVKAYTDGGYVLTGFRYIPNTNRVFLMRTDAAGEPLWTRYMGNRGGPIPLCGCCPMGTSLLGILPRSLLADLLEPAGAHQMGRGWVRSSGKAL
jgi:hypothetical protein